jgi:hypothetical protein
LVSLRYQVISSASYICDLCTVGEQPLPILQIGKTVRGFEVEVSKMYSQNLR